MWSTPSQRRRVRQYVSTSVREVLSAAPERGACRGCSLQCESSLLCVHSHRQALANAMCLWVIYLCLLCSVERRWAQGSLCSQLSDPALCLEANDAHAAVPKGEPGPLFTGYFRKQQPQHPLLIASLCNVHCSGQLCPFGDRIVNAS